MKIFIFLFLLTPLCLIAQQERYSRVKIELNVESNIKDLAQLGLCIDHGNHRKNKSLITELSESEINLLDVNGINYEILISDVVQFLHQNHKMASSHCESASNTTTLITPENFEFGSLSGYYSHQEMLEQLDSMRTLYPNLITVKDSLPEVDGISTSHENRPIWMVKVSNNADVFENEPEMIYTALHHAREPGSLTQMIFYLWYLLENYGDDDQVTAILNHTELYFVPMLNPDGYVYNESTNPNGGGFWRKNRRDNGDGSFGVDLNRNYSYEWGFDNTGSSTDPNSDLYRGPSAGSEPEIKLITNFVDNHNFKFALNYHTFGGLLIYPWGYSDSLTQDSLEFIAFGEHLVSKNGYTKGTGTETVGYSANGNSDDWYYGDTNARSAIYSMTPEAGNAFWPAQNEIIPFCNDNLYPNLWMASYLLNYARLKFEVTEQLDNLSPQDINLNIRRLGLIDSMDFTVGFQNYSTLLISGVSDSIVFSNMKHLEDSNFTLNIQFNSGAISDGDTISLELFMDNGFFKDIYPIHFVYENSSFTNVVFEDQLSTLGLWNPTGSWGLDASLYKSPSTSIGDSPNGDYNNLTTSNIVLDTIFDLTNISSAFINMDVNFDIENDYDYVQFVAHSETDNQDYPLCGKYTNNGSADQLIDEPLYDGSSNGWKFEKVSLEDVYGHKIKLRFDFKSDQFSNKEGFNFDNFKVILNPVPVSLDEFDGEITIIPNPTSNFVLINGLKIKDKNIRVEVFNLNGKLILEQNLNTNKIDLGSLYTGVYLLKVRDAITKIVKI